MAPRPDLPVLVRTGSGARAGGAVVRAGHRPSTSGGAQPPTVSLLALDELWFQVSGTVCNLRCRHCFISCAPDNHSHWFMSRDAVRSYLEESRGLGVKEYYFTGGEPFMNREIEGILEDTLKLGSATVLTNATLIPPRRAEALAGLAGASPYSLELRVSLDGVTASMNDAIRGEGTFDRCMDGVRQLVAAGFLPIISCMRSWPEAETEEVLAAFHALLAGVGYTRPRLKILPPLLMGEEESRTRGYEDTEFVSHDMMQGFDAGQLLCSRARLVTARGVQACPILLESPIARLGDTLGEAVGRDAPLADAACFTCYQSGAICSNAPSGSGRDR